MNIDQIKKELEEFKRLKKSSRDWRALRGENPPASEEIPIEKHLEELILALEIERNRNDMMNKVNTEQSWRLQKAEEVIRFYAEGIYEAHPELTCPADITADKGQKAREYLSKS